MNRAEAEDFVYRSYMRAEKYQDYHARDAEKRRPELTRELIRARAGTPCAVVTGSKGKGSVSCMLSQILQTRLRVGLMTSPHLADFCERFRVNGRQISDDDLVRYMTMIRPPVEAVDSKLPPDECVSPMGIQALLGLAYFAGQRTQFNVFECGKGARYDDVNNIVHPYAVIGSIFPEHTRELGSTPAQIAADKAHVINGEQKMVFTAPQQEAAMQVIRRRAAEYGTPLREYGRDFRAENIRYARRGMLFDVRIGDALFRDVSIPLMGEHQARNCALAMALAKEVLGTFDPDAVRKKLAETDWPGRMEILSEEPFAMLDACVNPASCPPVLAVLRHLGMDRVTAVIGIPDDKDYAGVCREMRAAAEQIILTRSQNPHYVFTPGQCRELEREGIRAVWTESTAEAVERALSGGLPVVILGTTSVVAEVKALYSGSGRKQ